MNAAGRQVPPPGQLYLDHVSHFVPDLDKVAALLEELGFAVTPLSAQVTQDGPAGTSNRCVMLPQGYLEFLTPTMDTPNAQRMRKSMRRYRGVHLACFGTPAAEEEHARLVAHGFEPQPLVRLARKVEDGRTARFSVVRAAPGRMPEGRVQYVQHLAPQAIWRAQHLRHRNGVFGLAADQRTALRSGPQANAPAAPPRIVVSDEGAAARLRREGVPPLRAVAREDQPRMPTPRRRARLADGAPESAAMSIEDAQPVAIQKASVDLFHAEARVADRLAPPEAAPAARTGAEPAVEVRPARAPSLADKRAEPARQVAETPAAATAIGVVIIDGSITPEAAIRAVADVGDLVFVAQSSDQESIEAARRAGVDVVEVADRALTFGRARNAGYRQLKKRRPALNYVQFIDSDVALDPQWLSAAAKFMDRRPEVAAIEGKIRFENEASSVFARMAAIDANGESGETDTVGANLFVRADAFEGAGGFRGDLMVNETRDLCIRLRRRGAHIWRLDADMGIAGARSGGLAAHWESAVRRGFEFAHGAALHGAAPDRLFISERARALVWGALLPAMIALGAIGGALFAVFLSPLTNPILLAVGALAVGALVYLIKFVVTAAGLGSRSAAWPYAFWSTLGRTPEAAGIFRYFFGGARPRQQKKPA